MKWTPQYFGQAFAHAKGWVIEMKIYDPRKQTLKQYFNDIFNEACKKYYDASGASLDLNHYYDAELRIDSICPETARELFKSLYPYCYASNPEPVFKISDIMISETELKEDTTWRMLTFYMLKDGKKTESRMKMFTSNYGTEINGLKADVYFTFSQNLDNTDLNVVDIVFKK